MTVERLSGNTRGSGHGGDECGHRRQMMQSHDESSHRYFLVAVHVVEPLNAPVMSTTPLIFAGDSIVPR